MKEKRLDILIALHLLLAVYSFSGIFSKLASYETFLSFRFCLYYGCVILLLGIYAIGWQQIIKRMPLTTAYANKSVTVIWGVVWGAIFFREPFTLGKIVGAVLVITGMIIFAVSDDDTEDLSHE